MYYLPTDIPAKMPISLACFSLLFIKGFCQLKTNFDAPENNKHFLKQNFCAKITPINKRSFHETLTWEQQTNTLFQLEFLSINNTNQQKASDVD